MDISLYQHSAGDFKVRWSSEDGHRGEERHFAYDFGGAIAFALGLKSGATARGEHVEFSLNLKNPSVNRGFIEGFIRGANHSAYDPRDDFGYTAHERAVINPNPNTSKDMVWFEELVGCLQELFKPYAIRI